MRGEGAFALPRPASLDSRLRGNDELECQGLFIFHFTLIFMLALRWFDRLTTNGMEIGCDNEWNGGRLRARKNSHKKAQKAQWGCALFGC